MFFIKNPKLTLKCLIIIIILTGIASYSLFQARNLIRGPVVNIESPKNGEATEKPLVEIKGQAKNISYITLNDRQIFVDKEGIFNQKLLLFNGYNIVKISAKDKFGRETNKIIELIYKETNPIGQTDKTNTNPEISKI